MLFDKIPLSTPLITFFAKDLIFFRSLFINDIDKCEAQLDKIINDITPMLTNTFEIEKSKIIHDVDPSGKSYIIEKQWLFPNGDRILVQCYNFAETETKKDQLRIGISNAYFEKYAFKK